MVTIRDVAAYAGVAISTVSKVLKNYPNVSEETKEKVNRAIKELNFVPNTIAQALSSKGGGRIALLVNMITHTQAIDEIDMQYLSGAIHRARELSLDVSTIFFSMIQDMEEDEMISYFQSQNIRGIIIYGMSREDQVLHRLIASQVFKLVLVDAPLVNPATSTVWVAQEEAQYTIAARMTADNEAEKILYIAGKKNGYVTWERLKGMKRLEAEKSLELKVVFGEFSERKARELTGEYAAEYDIVVCASDLMAIGAMRALVDMDIFRPVCGFDGITLMGYVGRQMYTVRQNFSYISEQAVVELHRLMNGGEGREIVLPYEIIRLKYEDIIG